MDSIISGDSIINQPIPPTQKNPDQAQITQEELPPKQDPKEKPPVEEQDQIQSYSDIAEDRRALFESMIENVINTNVEFTTDHEEGDSYIKIIDRETNEVIRTIPTEEMRKVLNNISDHIGQLLDTNA